MKVDRISQERALAQKKMSYMYLVWDGPSGVRCSPPELVVCSPAATAAFGSLIYKNSQATRQPENLNNSSNLHAIYAGKNLLFDIFFSALRKFLVTTQINILNDWPVQ